MRTLKATTASVGVLLLLLTQPVLAVPTFQVYAEGAWPGTIGSDQDTWFIDSSPFNLIVAGAYQASGSRGQKATADLVEVTLLLSVPQGETGVIQITGGDVGATLLDTRPSSVGPSGSYNPAFDADIDLLTNEPGNTAGYDGHTTKAFLPDNVNFNNHYPLQESISNFLIYGIGDFDKLPGAVSNYSTEDGISYNIADGEEKTFLVSVSGFSWVHFDAYGYEIYEDGIAELTGSWDINPGSHDVTFIPAPGAAGLAGIGIVALAWLRRRKVL